MSKVLRFQILPIYLFLALTVSALLVTNNHSHAAWKNDFGTFRIGVLASHPIAQNEKNISEFANYFTNQLGLNVEVIRFRSLGSLMDAHGSARVHYAIHSARSYATMSKICNCLKAIVRPLTEQGSGGFRSVLVIKESKRVGFAAGQNLRIGYSLKNSMSGWIVPKRAIDDSEISENTFIEVGSVDNVVAAFENDELDGFFAWVPASNGDEVVSGDQLFGGFYNARFESLEKKSVVWWSKTIHHGPHAVHASIPDELSEELTDVLLNLNGRAPEIMDIVEPYFTGGFEKAESSDYNVISAVLNLGSLSVPSVFDGKLRTSFQ